MKKILLTGATGFIGSFVLNSLLEKDYEVHAVTRNNILQKSKKNLYWHNLDLLSKSETEKLIKTVKPSHLLHLAWFVEHGKFWNSSKNLDWISATLNLAKHFRENGGERFVFSGTCYEYDLNGNGILDEEKTDLSPATLYGTAKLSTNLILRKFSETDDFSYACGRPFFIFGPRENLNRLVSSVIISLLKDEPVKTSHGNQIRDFIYVQDLADAFVFLLQSEVRGSINLASGKGIKVRELVEIIANLIGKPELLRIGAITIPYNEPPLIVANIKRLQNEVGFRQEYNLQRTLFDTISWWKERL